MPIQACAMVLAKDVLFIAGPPDVINEVDLWHKPDDPELKRKTAEQTEAWRGRSGGSLWAVSTTDGNCLSRVDLEAPPVFDGMIVADNKLFLSLMSGKIICYGAESSSTTHKSRRLPTTEQFQ